MRRRLLIALTTVGSALVLLGGVGLFAAINDRAHGPDNKAESGELRPIADIEVAPWRFCGGSDQPECSPATPPGALGECGTFADDLASPLFDATFVTLKEVVEARFCLRNVGEDDVELTAGVDKLTDTELACTGDEALFDTSCSTEPPPEPLAGELSEVVVAQYYTMPCSGGDGVAIGAPLRLTQLRDDPIAIGPLESESGMELRCFRVTVAVDQTKVVKPQDRLRVQTDEVTWRFVWQGESINVP